MALEYILLLAVSILIIVGALVQFNSSLRNYVRGFFGNYIACMLEVGELPGGAVCSPEIPTFNELNIPPVSQVASSSNNSGNTTTGDTRNNTNAPRSGGSETLVRNPSSSQSLAVNSRSSLRSGNGSTPIGNIRSRISSADEAALLSASNLQALQTSSGTSSIKNRTTELGTGRLLDDERRNLKSGKRVQGVDKNAAENQVLKAKVIPEPEKTFKRGVAQIDEDSFSFTNIIRFLIIMAILILLFILIGGQLNRIRKSWQK